MEEATKGRRVQWADLTERAQGEEPRKATQDRERERKARWTVVVDEGHSEEQERKAHSEGAKTWEEYHRGIRKQPAGVFHFQII